MGVLIKFLTDNFIYFAFAIILLILALVGYIVDASRTEKLKKEMANNIQNENVLDIPIANLGENVTLGETVNKATNNIEANVKASEQTQTDVNATAPPVQPKKM